ncbi:hypothetical protein EYR38_002005 [Pleurotus pulmonarius]|nr:hypothetical protein EYR38_002005 [Pleurotus pulmonarius]
MSVVDMSPVDPSDVIFGEGDKAASSKPKFRSSARKRKSEDDAAAPVAKKSKQPSAEENTEAAEENTESAEETMESAEENTESAEETTESAEETTESADENTEVYVRLGNQKRASIGSFKGHTYVDIRRYFGLDEKPTKQGITLNKAQWEILKANFGKIDRLLAEATK